MIYSMTMSSPADCLNRFNVATSRACCRYLELAQELPIEALRPSSGRRP